MTSSSADTRLKTKIEIREKFKAKRRELTKEILALSEERVWQSLEKFGPFDNLLIYSAIQNEVPTERIFANARASGTRVYFPRIKEGRTMDFYEIENLSDLVPERLTLAPPEKDSHLFKVTPSTERKTFILVPGFAFSRTGHRIGFGRGFYDQFLYREPSLTRIGIAHPFQISLEDWAPESHDEVMDWVLTSQGLWSSPRI